jgi:hypothetical protein
MLSGKRLDPKRIAMFKTAKILALFLFQGWAALARGEVAEKVVDISARPGVTQRMLVISPKNPKATIVLLAGGQGGLQISAS